MFKRAVTRIHILAVCLGGMLSVSCEHAGSDDSNDILRRAANELRDKARWTTKTGTVIVARLQYIVVSAHSGNAEAVNLIEAEPGTGVQIWHGSGLDDLQGPIRAKSGVLRVKESCLEADLSDASFDTRSGATRLGALTVTLGKIVDQ